MNEERFYELTTKFLSREISESEKNELSIILQIDQYKSLFESIVAGWNNSTRDNAVFNTEKALNIFVSRLKETGKPFSMNDSSTERKKLILRPALMKVAASILFFALLVTAYLYLNTPREIKVADPVWRELVTASGEKYELILPDKSRLVVNGQSKVKYPLKFTKKREIFLEGEAYCEISHDSLKPFIVSTNNISTVVLGTKFNVSAFPQENSIEVSLIEGSIKVFNSKSGMDNEAILLKPMQQLRYDSRTSISTVEGFDVQETIGWKDNILKFNDANLKDVLTKLERAFGIKFELSDKSYNNFKITGNFQKATHHTICEALKRLTKLQYKIVKENNEIKKIVFYNKK